MAIHCLQHIHAALLKVGEGQQDLYRQELQQWSETFSLRNELKQTLGAFKVVVKPGHNEQSLKRT